MKLMAVASVSCTRITPEWRRGGLAVHAEVETKTMSMGIRAPVKIIWALWTTLVIHAIGTRRMLVVLWRHSQPTPWECRHSKHAVLALVGPLTIRSGFSLL
jgi:hypothetical protein